MNEPVAYWHIPQLENNEPFVSFNRSDSHVFEDIPLYTYEDLHPRVQMTSKEFDEWKELYYHLNEFFLPVHKMLDEVLDSIGVERGTYTELAKRVYQDNDFMSVSKNQAELANLFVIYSPDKPEETIEIIPDKKWFVISKHTDDDGYYSMLVDIDFISPRFALTKTVEPNAVRFDTKEEAEEWCNPLVEAVLLPVEGE